MAPDLPPLRVLEHREAHVAGRVGLANAVAELLEVGVAAVAARLDEVGRTVRHELAGLAGWQVVGPLDAPGAITAIEPLDGRDVFAVRERLLGEHGILTTACSVARAPLEMTRPSLRISPHVDLEPEHVVALRTALGHRVRGPRRVVPATDVRRERRRRRSPPPAHRRPPARR